MYSSGRIHYGSMVEFPCWYIISSHLHHFAKLIALNKKCLSTIFCVVCVECVFLCVIILQYMGMAFSNGLSITIPGKTWTMNYNALYAHML